MAYGKHSNHIRRFRAETETLFAPGIKDGDSLFL